MTGIDSFPSHLNIEQRFKCPHAVPISPAGYGPLEGTKSMLQLVPHCAPILATQRWTILLVEDNPTLRDLIRRILEKLDFQVLAAPDGRSAVTIAKAHTEGIDLLLTDVVMPGMDGFDVADQLAAIHLEARVLFLSGYGEESSYVYGRLTSGPSRFLQKPFTQGELLDRIQDLLAESSLRPV